MLDAPRRPSGPRGLVGAAAEDAAVQHLTGLGWTILARNVRIERDEIDVIAVEPQAPSVIVIVEVRSRSTPGYGSALETLDGRKVRRLYRAAMTLRRVGHSAIMAYRGADWRVDALAVTRDDTRQWTVTQHIRGVEPP